MPNPWTVQCAYYAHWATTVCVEAETLDEALEKAIEAAHEDIAGWRSTGHATDTFVDTIAEGRDTDPWGKSRLPVPDRYSQHGPLPLITIHDPGTPQQTLQIDRGQVLVRFETPDGDVTTKRAAQPPAPGDRPTVVIRRRPDGAPDVEVHDGDVRVRLLDR